LRGKASGRKITLKKRAVFLRKGGVVVLHTYTVKYTKINSGYMGQVLEWTEVITEGKTLEECREMLMDALREMVIAYRQQNKEIPIEQALLEHLPIEV